MQLGSRLARSVLFFSMLGCALTGAAQDEAAVDRAFAEAGRLDKAGRVMEAAELHAKVLEQRLRMYGPSHERTLASYATYGEALRRAGNKRGAIENLERAAAEAERVWGPTSQSTLNTLNNLALAHFDAGNLAEALRRQEAVVRLSTAALGEGAEPTLVRSISYAAMLSSAGRHLDAALLLGPLMARSAAVLGPKHSTTAYAMFQFGDTLLKAKRYAEAEALARRCHALYVELQGERAPITLAVRNNIGVALIGLKRFDEAIEVLGQVYGMRRDSLGIAHGQTIGTLNDLAGAYYQSGQRERGAGLLRQALAEYEAAFGPGGDKALTILSNAAVATVSLGLFDETLRLRGELIRRVEALRRSGLSPDNRRALFANWVGKYREYAALLDRAGRKEESLQIAELTRARTLLELSAARRALASGLIPVDERARLGAIETRIAALDTDIARLVAQPQKRQAVIADKESAVRELEAGMKALEARFPKLAELTEVLSPGLADARALLPPGSVYLSYLVQDNLFMLLAISPEHGLVIRRPGIVRNLTQSATAFRYLLTIPAEMRRALPGAPRVWRLQDGSYRIDAIPPMDGAAPIDDPDTIADYLGEKLLQPMRDMLRGAQRVIVAPDGPLAMLPFEALRLDRRYLIETTEVQYTQSLGMYALSRARAADYERIADRLDLLAVGGAIYQPFVQHSPLVSVHHALLEPPKPEAQKGSVDSGVPQAFKSLNIAWANLPGSEREVEQTASLFDGARRRLLKGSEASEERLWRLNESGELAKYRYLLFATHGYLSTFEPRLSSVVLSQFGNRGGHDGFVTAAEWPLYNLRSDLMMVSACNTGVGQIVQGEGVMGLPFALHVAGNRNTVLTLWAVNDQSTADFVVRFFTSVRTGTDHVAALTLAKRAFIADPRRRSPYFWAPFVLYGS